MQQVWLEALTGTRPVADTRPWLAGVLRNLVRMRYRSNANRRAREEASAPSLPPVRPDELVERVETERTLAALVLELAEPYRSTLLLRFYEDLSAAEISRRHGVPAGTVRWRLKQGLDQLRKQLDQLRRGDRRSWSIALVPTAVGNGNGLLVRTLNVLRGVLMMKTPLKVATAAAIILVLASLGTRSIRRRHVAPVDGGGARVGAIWTGPAVAGANGRAAPEIGGIGFPAWFGQRNAPVRRVAGRVSLDDGSPVAAAHVELGSVLSDAGVLAPLVRTTRADGRFDFGGVPPARYTIAASAAGHSPEVIGVDTRDPTTSTDQLQLRLGDCIASIYGQVNDASGGTIAGARICYAPTRDLACATSDEAGRFSACLSPQQTHVAVSARGYGAIHERVEGKGRRVKRDFSLSPEAIVSGRVVRADDGQPVAGANVRALSVGWGQRYPAPAATSTDAEGRFTLSGLAPGRHRIAALAERLASSDAVDILVGAGRTTANLVLRVVAESRVRGIVVDGGQPVAGATITLAARGSPKLLGIDAVTQADGSFVMEPVRHGTAPVHVEGYELIAPATIVVDKAEVTGLKVAVASLASIAGKITREGKPVSGAHVFYTDRLEPVVSDVDGNYLIRGLLAETYELWATDDVAGAFGTGPKVTVGKAEHRTGIDIDLPCAGSISGVVVEEDGTPAAGLTTSFGAIHSDDVGSDVTAPDGSFVARSLRGGDDYQPTIRVSGRSRIRLQPTEAGFPTVSLKDGASHVTGVRIVIRRAHLAIEGRIVDADGEPVSDATVSAVRADGDEPADFPEWRDYPSDISGGDGRFTISDLDAGMFAIEARAGDGSQASKRNIAAGAKGLVITLQASGGIDGELVGFRTPPTVSTMPYRPGAWMPASLASIDATGFHVRGLPPGIYQARAIAQGEGDAQDVEVRPGRIATVSLRSRGTATVTGRVLDWRSQTPVSGIRCYAGSRSGSGLPAWGSTETITDGDGRFTLEGIAAGMIAVACVGDGPYYSDGLAFLSVANDERAICEVPVVKSKDGVFSDFGATIDLTPAAGLSATVLSVQPRTPAERAGVRAGDVITAVDGVSIAKLTPLGVLFVMTDRVAGEGARVSLNRGGRTIEATVRSMRP
ncbi:MAG: hypothetical protein JWN44_3118 [Myxococcales bacterium]|nr:hypothetical protein [Myxococcales bacterium]